MTDVPTPRPSATGSSAEGDFSLLQDFTLEMPVLIARWCPAMDLLALALADGQVCIYRHSLQARTQGCEPNTIARHRVTGSSNAFSPAYAHSVLAQCRQQQQEHPELCRRLQQADHQSWQAQDGHLRMSPGC